MKKVALFCAFVLLISTLLTSCFGSPLVGTWLKEDENMTYTFNKDGTGYVGYEGQKANFVYSTNKDQLKMTVVGDEYETMSEEEKTITCTYKISGKTLSMTAEGETITLKKQ